MKGFIRWTYAREESPGPKTPEGSIPSNKDSTDLSPGSPILRPHPGL